MKLAKRKLIQLNIWPGFVDVLATLLIVTIFTIMISGIAQIYFNDVIGKKKTEISVLDMQIEEIAEKLSMQINENKKIKKINFNLEKLNKQKNKEISDLVSNLKKEELEKKILNQKNFSIIKNNENLLKKIRDKNEDLKFLTTEISKRKDIIKNNKETLKTLNLNILELKKQLNELSKQLDFAEQEDKDNKVLIRNLGKKLNLALAGKVQELSEYQSMFLKKVKNLIGHRSDIIISGDRFIFPSKIFFKTASDKLEIEGNLELKKIAKGLTEISKIIPKEIDWVLRIDGHTDIRPISNSEFPSNWHLSSSRAIKIVSFLIDEGIPAERLMAAGFGEYQPILKENTEIAFERNRRIEIKLTNR